MKVWSVKIDFVDFDETELSPEVGVEIIVLEHGDFQQDQFFLSFEDVILGLLESDFEC